MKTIRVTYPYPTQPPGPHHFSEEEFREWAWECMAHQLSHGFMPSCQEALDAAERDGFLIEVYGR